MAEKQIKIVTENRKARHDYFIEETYEVGIALKGTEVKSLRAGRANLKDSYAQVQNGEMFLFNMHISPYEQGNRFNVDPVRPRKLLLHKKEINSLFGKVMQQGLTLVPLKVYFQKGRAKVELALARGKKVYDKRSALAERDAKREVERALRGKDRY
ncbi:MAG: SsrA-binding protein SmpB [Clostridia bacterium]|jgi:SsrA-binding protein|nr:SsrA-binding protein SmpB [Clostridia bacterium]MDD4146388.1 SsrA-binding protein SmpB [Clostridia bacterium]MDD4665032.1 SsrA-binding protein SmpB [Clostridia bacterium]